MIDLLRIRNPAAFQLPTILAFVREAISIHTLVPDVDAAILELAGEIEKDGIGLFLTRENGQFRGFALCQWSSSRMNPVCTVAHFYNRGSHDARRKLVQACIDFARAGGFQRVVGVDMNGRPRAFAKVFQSGGTPVYVGTIYAFDIGQRGD